MPEPDLIWLAPQSVGDVLDRRCVDATSASAFSVGGVELAAGQPRKGSSGTGLRSGSGDSGLGVGSSGGSLTTQMPPAGTRGPAAGTNLVVPTPGPSTTTRAIAPSIGDLLGNVAALDE